MVGKKLELEIEMLHSRVCYALADQTRILILYYLAEEPRYVNELVDAMQVPQSTISRHLRVLRERNLVDTKRDGSAIKYTLADPRIIEALDILRNILATQLANSVEIAQTIME